MKSSVSEPPCSTVTGLSHESLPSRTSSPPDNELGGKRITKPCVSYAPSRCTRATRRPSDSTRHLHVADDEVVDPEGRRIVLDDGAWTHVVRAHLDTAGHRLANVKTSTVAEGVRLDDPKAIHDCKARFNARSRAMGMRSSAQE